MKLETLSEKVLYVWDYFYITHVPARGDEATWRRIERATCRIRTAESDAEASSERLELPRNRSNAIIRDG